MARGGDVHMGVAEFYDIPTISMRNIFLPQIFEDSKRIMDIFVKFDKKLEGDKDTLDNRDTRHVSQYVHRIAGNLTGAYIDMQLCEMDRIEAEAGHSRADELYPKPRVPRVGCGRDGADGKQKLWDKFDVDKTLPPFRPQCSSMNSRRNPFKPTENKGWREWFRKDVPEKVRCGQGTGEIICWAERTAAGDQRGQRDAQMLSGHPLTSEIHGRR